MAEGQVDEGRGFEEVAQEVDPDDAHPHMVVDVQVDGPTFPNPEATTQADGGNIQEEVHGDDQPAGDEGGRQVTSIEFFGNPEGAHRYPAPHEASEEGELVGRDADGEVVEVAVVVDIRQTDGAQFQGKAGQGAG